MKRCEFKKKDAKQVWIDIKDAWSEFGMENDVLAKLYSVSDQGSNVKKCLKDNTKARKISTMVNIRSYSF